MLWINLAGLLMIVFIVWWFWLFTPTQNEADGEHPIPILVKNGVYEPARIHISPGQTITLRFLRKDPSPCAEIVQFPDLGISISLPVDNSYNVRLPPLQKGEYNFHCQMQMYRGTLVVD
ncbi:cupredoxin domain-containing protein [Ferrimonas sp.]|uniref:cupredoxin domain-containing protein n=1 Tax=Ferrimonas sp. TaxID=2080861 RepID=UPI003A9112B7